MTKTNILPRGIDVRRIRRGDEPALVEMIAALAAHHADTAQIDPAAVADLCLGRAPWFTVLVAVRSGQSGLAGYAALCPLGQLQFGVRGMDMHHLYVRAAHRGQGIGRALIAASLAEAARQGCRYVMVGTDPGNHAAQAAYLACGFEPAPEPGPRFRKRLSAPSDQGRT